MQREVSNPVEIVKAWPLSKEVIPELRKLRDMGS